MMELLALLKNKLRMTSHGEMLRKQRRWFAFSFGPRRKATQTPEAARANIMSCAKKHTHTHNHTHQQNSHKSLHTVRKPLDCKVFGQKCGQLGQQTFAATISVILERFFRKERRRCEAFGSCVSSAPSQSSKPRNFSCAFDRSKVLFPFLLSSRLASLRRTLCCESVFLMGDRILLYPAGCPRCLQITLFNTFAPSQPSCCCSQAHSLHACVLRSPAKAPCPGQPM
mmetsp:Transcript_25822/g.37905  ORF Transcript_25822/g.37905 Transcript_25822/m.37905 type:complete len:226 (+) Transcript_25822:1338-2015(+)